MIYDNTVGDTGRLIVKGCISSNISPGYFQYISIEHYRCRSYLRNFSQKKLSNSSNLDKEVIKHGLN
jgi:hypothetical protein